jgi:hypothetical protein
MASWDCVTLLRLLMLAMAMLWVVSPPGAGTALWRPAGGNDNMPARWSDEWAAAVEDEATWSSTKFRRTEDRLAALEEWMRLDGGGGTPQAGAMGPGPARSEARSDKTECLIAQSEAARAMALSAKGDEAIRALQALPRAANSGVTGVP